MQEIVLNAQTREPDNNHGIKEARKKGLVPGIFYRKDIDNIPFYVKDLSLKKIVYSAHTSIINLTFEGDKAYSCIVKDVQYDPVTDEPIHCDLIGLFEDQTIIVDVPVVLKGQPAGQKDGGLTQQLVYKVKIECLPKHIPRSIELDITPLNIGDSIQVKDIKMDNVSFREKESVSVVSVVPPNVAAATPAAGQPAEAAEATEPEVVSGKGKKEEEK
jgi:large subunit ribosomal protein L25